MNDLSFDREASSIEEHLQEKLKEFEQEREELTARLLELTRQEKELEDKIQELSDQEDVGVEVFSPRSSANEIQQQISWLKKSIEEFHYSQLKVQNSLEDNAQKAEQYQQLLLEARSKLSERMDSAACSNGVSNLTASAGDGKSLRSSGSAVLFPSSGSVSAGSTGEGSFDSGSSSEMTDLLNGETRGLNPEEVHESLEDILKRVDRCLNLIHSDRVKCKNELKNLKYYLKALITKYSSLS